MFVGIQTTKWLREDLSTTYTFDYLGLGAIVPEASSRSLTGVFHGITTQTGLRWNPMKGDHPRQPLKPFLDASFGPVIGVERGTQSTRSRPLTWFSGYLGVGFDRPLTRSFSMGMNVGYNWTTTFGLTDDLRGNFNGVQVALRAGWLSGQSRSAAPSRSQD